ncbi:MAG TPA: hypothetical protein VHC70_03860 [Phycisphaerales bacterium]|nr:hypothetical protein [Phycisphaerales bacterium]
MNERNRRARLDDIRRVAYEMRETPIVAPDLTSSILDRVDAERPFLAPSVRRKLPWIRIGVGGCVVLTALGIALTYRWAPRAVQAIAQQPAPISDVVQCVECCAAHKFIPRSAPMLTLRESDATRFLAAMVAANRISENEGRAIALRPAESRPALAAGLPRPDPDESAPLVMPTQAVSMQTPAPVYTHVASAYAIQYETSTYPSDPAVSSDKSTHPVIFSADIPRVNVVPTFLEHDLDGTFLPR